MSRELYHQSVRNIWQNNHAKKIEVKHLPSTYKLFGKQWLKRIAKDDNITDHYGSNFYS